MQEDIATATGGGIRDGQHLTAVLIDADAALVEYVGTEGRDVAMANELSVI